MGRGAREPHPSTIASKSFMMSNNGAMDLRAMGLRKAQERQYVRLRFIHQAGKLRELRTQLIGDRAPLRDRPAFLPSCFAV
jgi:hypothetical protein